MCKNSKLFLPIIFLILQLGTAGNRLFSEIAVSNINSRLAGIDQIVENGIKAKAFPGCQVVVLKKGVAIYDKCFGTYTYENTQKVTPTTLYDLASLSKTTGTLLAIMKLYDNGQLKLTDRISKYLPFLQSTDKEDITISNLLFHESGLPASLSCYNLVMGKASENVIQLGSSSIKFKSEWVSKIPLPEYTTKIYDGFYMSNAFHQAAMQMIARTHLRSKTYLYSCVNFILLKEIAEAVSGMTLDAYLTKEFYEPMKISPIAYLPLRIYQKNEIAPTLKRDFLRNGLLQGEVQDPDAALLGGVSGNAGLFASARAVASVYQMLLNGGEINGVRCLSEKTCKLFTTTISASGRRGLGFDKPVPSNPAHNPCCSYAPSAVYGHTGYTGTCCWVDPANELVYVFLSNRTYPNDGVNKLSKMGIRSKIQSVIYQSMKK
jgi:CubicO group peptidase (beta-lactamase class C family)